MVDEKRRTFDELVVRYELEPSICDIYVEGLIDKSLIEWFLNESDLETENITVYEIDTVDIPTNELFELGLNDANRSRLIVFAIKLQTILKSQLPNVICIADKDFDDLIEHSLISRMKFELLLFTDYTSIEMYLFEPHIIEKFIKLALNSQLLKADDILQNIAPILKDIFLIRAANEDLNYGMTWLEDTSFKRHFNRRRKEELMIFDLNNFVDRYLNKNNKISCKNIFLEKVAKLSQKNIVEIRNKIRGHDFIQIICWYIEPYLSSTKKSFSQPDTLSGALLCCLDINILIKENLFQEIIVRLKIKQEKSNDGNY